MTNEIKAGDIVRSKPDTRGSVYAGRVVAVIETDKGLVAEMEWTSKSAALKSQTPINQLDPSPEIQICREPTDAEIEKALSLRNDPHFKAMQIANMLGGSPSPAWHLANRFTPMELEAELERRKKVLTTSD